MAARSLVFRAWRTGRWASNGGGAPLISDGMILIFDDAGRLTASFSFGSGQPWLMAIYRLFKTMVLDPADIEILSAAYEDALRVLKIDRQDPVTELIAAKIIKVARLSGETSPETSDR